MARVAVLVVALAGCLRIDTVVCQNGVTCPRGTTCDEANGGCIVPEQQTVCANAAAGEACRWAGGDGECINGVCLGQLCLDGRRSGAERCDPTSETNATTCTSPELGYYRGGEVPCRDDCTWDTSSCSEFCGDHMLNGNEVCETGLPPIESCVDYGFDHGRLGCGACAATFGECGSIGWRRRILPATPSRAIAIDAELLVAIDDVAAGQLAARFDGHTWVGLGTYVATGESPTAKAIAGTAPNAVWTGGATNATGGDGGFVARFDGTSWTRVRGFPAAVTALWAVGSHVFAIAGADLYIFDGTTWSMQALAANAHGYWISGSSEHDVWIGGGKLWHGGAAQPFTEVTVPVTGMNIATVTVTGVHAFDADRVVVATHEASLNTYRFSRVVIHVRENGGWRSVLYRSYGSTEMKLGALHARSGTDVYLHVTDLATSVPAVPTVLVHHDGLSWSPLTDETMTPSAFAGSDRAIFAVDRNIATSFLYSGSVWLAKPTFENPIGQITGLRADQVHGNEEGSVFRTHKFFDGMLWTSASNPRGMADAVADVEYAIEINPVANPRLHYKNSLDQWAHVDLVMGQTDPFLEWIGIHGRDDVFLARTVSGARRYLHWAGDTIDFRPLETTNIPDGTVLDHIDCRPGVGCLAGGGTTLWRTPGDRNAWEAIASPDIGDIQTIWIGGPGAVLLGGTQGRIARGDGVTWTVERLPVNAEIVAIVGSSTDDVFALATSANGEHQLFHWNGTAWGRVRTPVSAFGSQPRQLWTDGRITYFGGGTSNPYFYALVRTDAW